MGRAMGREKNGVDGALRGLSPAGLCVPLIILSTPIPGTYPQKSKRVGALAPERALRFDWVTQSCSSCSSPQRPGDSMALPAASWQFPAADMASPAPGVRHIMQLSHLRSLFVETVGIPSRYACSREGPAGRMIPWHIVGRFDSCPPPQIPVPSGKGAYRAASCLL